MSDLKQELDSELSQLIHKYEDEGLDPNEIHDSLVWHTELVESRSRDQRVDLSADD